MVTGKAVSGRKYFRWILLSSSVIFACGSVATRTKFYEPVTYELQAGNLQLAIEKFEDARKKGSFDEKARFLYYINSGALYHSASEYDSSIASLPLAENAPEEYSPRA